MPIIRLLLKALLFAIGIIGYLAVSTLVLAICGFNLKRARGLLTKVITQTSKLGLWVFGVSVRKNFYPLESDENYLIVANHLSYLDILIISSFYPTCFVTSKEMKETPFLGQLCQLGGCLFVDRKNRRNIGLEVKELSDVLLEGLNVTIFPEAASTNGEAVIRFKRPLFQAAINSKSKVLPLCLNYRTLDGEKLTCKNRDKVFWYGKMGFFIHVVKLLSHRKIVAELSVMKSLDATMFADKNELADKCYEIIGQEFQIITHAQ